MINICTYVHTYIHTHAYACDVITDEYCDAIIMAMKKYTV